MDNNHVYDYDKYIFHIDVNSAFLSWSALKKLTEDLVEASKASTGNLAVNLTPVDLHEFLNQAIGEYEDRLANARLTLVANISGEGLAVSQVRGEGFVLSSLAKLAMRALRLPLRPWSP